MRVGLVVQYFWVCYLVYFISLVPSPLHIFFFLSKSVEWLGDRTSVKSTLVLIKTGQAIRFLPTLARAIGRQWTTGNERWTRPRTLQTGAATVPRGAGYVTSFFSFLSNKIERSIYVNGVPALRPHPMNSKLTVSEEGSDCSPQLDCQQKCRPSSERDVAVGSFDTREWAFPHVPVCC